VVAGGAAFLLGYLVTGIVVLVRGSRDLGPLADVLARLGEFGIQGPGPEHGIGWFYYATHFVDVTVTGRVPGVGRIATAAGVTATRPWTDALYLVPVGVLLLAGAVVAHRTGAATPWSGALRGASVAFGYLPVAILGAFLTAWSTSGPFGVSLSGAVSLPAVAVAGLVYPLAFGGLGGAAVVLWRA
jgi:hypothetical protein